MNEQALDDNARQLVEDLGNGLDALASHQRDELVRLASQVDESRIEEARAYAAEMSADLSSFGCALEFYADPETYEPRGHVQIDQDTAPIRGDRGDRARQALLESRTSDGVRLIALERARQRGVEGHTDEGDDGYLHGELALAAVGYATNPKAFSRRGRKPLAWPWDAKHWKPTPDDRTRELVKAGALIAAEIDRLIRAEKGNS